MGFHTSRLKNPNNYIKSSDYAVCAALKLLTFIIALLILSLVSVRHRPAHHLRGPGRDADGSAGPALPGALHPPHQPRRGSVAQGVAPVLDWEWICGEYQFDMTAYC